MTRALHPKLGLALENLTAALAAGDVMTSSDTLAHDVLVATLDGLRLSTWRVVCRHCGHDETELQLRHEEMFAGDATGETPDIVCLWPCGHAVLPGEWHCHWCGPCTQACEHPF